jgi:integrase
VATRKRLQTAIPGFGFIFRPVYTRNGEKKRSAVWHMQYKTRPGEDPVRRSTHTRDQETAFNELAKMHGRKANGEMVGSTPEKATFEDLFALLEADYRREERSSLADMISRLDKHLRPAFGSVRVLDLRKGDIDRFIESRRKAGLLAGTINKLLAYMRRSMQLGHEADPQLVLRIPPWFHKIDGERERTGTITHEMYRKLVSSFAAEAEHARLAFVIGYHTGLRRGAILSLKWEWVDWRDSVVRIPPPPKTTNKNKPRTVPIYGEMRHYLEMAYERWRQSPECPYIVQYEGRRVFSITGAVERAFTVAGLVQESGKTVSRGKRKGQPLLKPVALFHDLRRTAATMMHEEGFSLLEIMEACGWTSVTMPKRYIQQSVKHTQDMGRRLEAGMQRREAALEKTAQRPV